MLIDTHCHLTDPKFTDVKKMITEARDVGVEKIFIPADSIESSKRAVIIAEQEDLYVMVGVHPEKANNFQPACRTGRFSKSNPPIRRTGFQELEEMVGKSKRVIGIGEIGLDFYIGSEKTPLCPVGYAGQARDRQIEVFRAQMELAVRLALPVVVHMREAEKEMRGVMAGMKELPKGQFHCFAGSEEFLKYVLGKGFYVSFAGNVTFKSAHELRRLLRMVPLDRLLLETDAPYLAPEPVRGTVNTPANVKIVAKFVAAELALDTNKIIEQTGKNALCLYSLDT